MLRRLLLSLGVAVIALLLAEGALSLLAGRSLLQRARFAPSSTGQAILHDDAERLAASRLTEGIYRYHPDPLVGMVLKPGADQLTLGVPFSTDALGLRTRRGPPADEDALRVAVLGDSVAFGFGLADDETIAQHLERILRDVRGDEARQVVCLTVAAPGWNHANATRFLIDHWETVRPDVVVYLPIENDTSDTFTVTEAGHRRTGIDLSQRDPWLRVDFESGLAYLAELTERYASGRLDAAGIDAPTWFGPQALTSDLSGESRLRYDANARSITDLAAFCARNGTRFALLYFQQPSTSDGYTMLLRERLLAAGLTAPQIAGFADPPPSCLLPDNPHPSSEGTFALARWTAEALLDAGSVDRGADLALPKISDAAAAQRARDLAPDAIRARAARVRDDARARLRTTIEFKSGQGTAQIYGGLNPDGSMATRLLALLPGGKQVVVRVRGARGAQALGDVTLAVEIEGRRVGELHVPLAGEPPAKGTFDVPTRDDPSLPIEVKLVSETWFADTFKGRTQLVSCQPIDLVVR